MAMQEILPGVYLVEANGRKGFGYGHFVRRPPGSLLLDGSRISSFSDAFPEPSFEALRDLDFDTVVPCTSYAGTEYFVDTPDVNAAIDAMIAACPRP